MDDFRYERKFFISDLSRQEVESIIRLHPASFTEIYHERFVNNLYLDTLDFSNFFTTVDGVQSRVKIRIRWYGDLFGEIEAPTLELKIKNGHLGKKISFPLMRFRIEKRFRNENLRNVLEISEIPDRYRHAMQFFNPVLLNRYRRKYFLSRDRDFRITIDWDQSFYQIGSNNNSFSNRYDDNLSVILELKYANGLDGAANYVTSRFPFRLSKNSKYVKGIENLYSW